MELNLMEIRIDTFRRTFDKNQWFKNDIGVRLTHIPSGIFVECEESQSQHRNKTLAFARLANKLKELENKKFYEPTKLLQ